MADLSLHTLDKRLSSVEEWKETMVTVDLPSILETIETEIPAHYTKRIAESEVMTMLRIGNLIDEKLDKRFGWQSRILEAVVVGGIVALIVFGLGKL